ncbi:MULTISPECIES: nuclease [Clostridium]|uniref:nuclease n=1 Tax=Clostridium TaxID=1485 RepID=UPI000DFA1F97|nr:nuclease [Clostridium sporogenes]MCW6085559.1 nuclease [Clostridium sporogenes]STC76584.1 GIY-YIG domain-containing protein [Clostridium botulinum]
MGKIKVQGNIYGMGIYGFTDYTDKILYVGSGMMNDRKQNHEYHLKNENYKNNNKKILQEEYEKDNLTFQVLHFSVDNSTYLNSTTEEKQKIQKSLEEKEQFYYNLHKDTCCNEMRKIRKHSTSPTLETTYKRKKANQGIKNPNVKYDLDTILEIKQMIDMGLSNTEISKKTSVNRNYISQIRTGQKWSSVNILPI